MAAIEVVNLRGSYQADVRRRESKEFYAWHQDAQDDRAAVRAEIEILRKVRLAYEREYFRDSGISPRVTASITDNHATKAIMRIQALEAGARVDTLVDTGSSS
ncbi:hypothetical protein Tco_1323119 [Tanacetum coccineum]